MNGLLSAAVERGNPLFAERIHGLFLELGLMPDAITYSLLLEARAAGGDAVGAASAFDDLIHCKPLAGLSVKAINKHVKRLCSAEPPDFTQTLSVLGHIEAREVDLDPDTVVALCEMFLRGDKSFEVIDTLNIHLKRFSLDDRKVVLESMAKYCMDRDVSTARAWDCYSMLRQFFPEASNEQRLALMESFFGRKRADMACQVFGHMRERDLPDMRPDLSAYVDCLEGLGHCPDEDSLQRVHNMFKMDSVIQPTTRLYNAFMIAFSACENPYRAFEFWERITTSAEGPSYASLSIIFRVCMVHPFGLDKAKGIWAKIRRMDISIPHYVYVSYILMNAAQGQLDEVMVLLSGMKAAYGKVLDYPLAAEIFNAFPTPELQTHYKAWLALEFPEVGVPISKTTKLVKTLEGTDRIPHIKPKKLRA